MGATRLLCRFGLHPGLVKVRQTFVFRDHSTKVETLSWLMLLTMRPTGGHPVYGRIYEDASASTPADLRWFWSVTVYVDPKAGIITSGKVATLDEAKAQFETAWRRSSSPARCRVRCSPARIGSAKHLFVVAQTLRLRSSRGERDRLSFGRRGNGSGQSQQSDRIPKRAHLRVPPSSAVDLLLIRKVASASHRGFQPAGPVDFLHVDKLSGPVATKRAEHDKLRILHGSTGPLIWAVIYFPAPQIFVLIGPIIDRAGNHGVRHHKPFFRTDRDIYLKPRIPITIRRAHSDQPTFQ
jgi:hypothetical protein